MTFHPSRRCYKRESSAWAYVAVALAACAIVGAILKALGRGL